MDEHPEQLKTGTTTMGIVCTNGVILATEHRATMGPFIAHKTTQKLFKIDDNLGLTVAGLVGDAQTLARYLSYQVEIYKLRHKTPMSVKAASTLMANILNSNKYYGFWVALVIGGVDRQGGHVYSLDSAGGSIPDKYVSTGSGSPYVYGVLEDHYEDSIDTDKGVDIAIRALTAAMKRDSASGDGIEIGVITKDSFVILPEEEIAKRKKKMKLQ